MEGGLFAKRIKDAIYLPLFFFFTILVLKSSPKITHMHTYIYENESESHLVVSDSF